MKLYKCECFYCIFPFGNGAPVCVRKYELSKDRKDLIQCTEKGCKYYKANKKGLTDTLTK